VDQFPKSSTGKILKRVLRKDLLEQVDKEGWTLFPFGAGIVGNPAYAS
jgi:hypothetical protein